jgi:mannose-1-phosphate guanylyltransferase / mannose-6-phosphate isomerase
MAYPAQQLPDHVPAALHRAVILAGGTGTRLWPLSRLQLPKQFLRLHGEKTLLETTIDRLSPLIAPTQALIVTAASFAKGEAYNAVSAYETLLEPVPRNTAPAIALAAAWMLHEAREGDPLMIVLPADHVIKRQDAFQQSLQDAVQVASAGKLVTFGIRPTRPDTGFGYVKARPVSSAAPLPRHARALRVEHFAEKPDAPTAAGFLAEGSYFWNSGMFVWRASAILAEIERFLPQVHAIVEEMRACWAQDQGVQEVVDRLFPHMPSISIDHGVLEKSPNVLLLPCDIGWSDVGSWDAVHEIAEQDACGNALQGNVIAEGCRNSLIHSSKRLVAAVGVEDVCVIETPDAVLVTKRGESQRVREIVEALKQRNAPEHLLHLTVQRPWGSYTVLEERSDFKMKRITVNPGATLSLQRHQHRSEHWVVVSGTATVVRGDELLTVAKNESTYIPIGVKHRLANRGKIPLHLIEVQVGEYLEEDDIERYDDDYGRN